MHNPYQHDTSPQSEQEWLEREEQMERFARMREREIENNGEFRDVDPETGCTEDEIDPEPKPAGSAYQPMQMELFSKEELAA